LGAGASEDHSRIALGLLISTIPVYFKLGHEFMPPLNEGAYLYMPTALPGMSVTESAKNPSDTGQDFEGVP